MTRALPFIATALVLCTSPAGAQHLSVRLHDGLADVEAQDVPLRQILDEWARVGNVAVSNADKTSAAPVTLTLTDVPEKSALATLLRDVSGYMLAPRSDGTGPSSFSRILILPTSTSPRPLAPAVAVRPANPAASPRRPFAQEPQRPDQGEDLERAREAAAEALQRVRERPERGELPTPPETRRMGSRTAAPRPLVTTMPTAPSAPATSGPTAAAGSTGTLGSAIGSAQPGVITPPPPPPPASRPRQNEGER